MEINEMYNTYRYKDEYKKYIMNKKSPKIRYYIYLHQNRIKYTEPNVIDCGLANRKEVTYDVDKTIQIKK